MKHIFKKALLLLGIITLSACSNDRSTLRVGTISGPETELMQAAQKVAKEQYQLSFDIFEFTDYNQPNAALNDKDIDANMFQHQPYLDQQNKDKHYDLIAVGKTFIYPMGIYSAKITQINQIPDQAIVALPNDPSNEGRALLLLQKANLVKLKKAAGVYATPADILDNPKHLRFKELDAAQLGRALPDVTIAIINSNYAIPAGLSPTKDAIFLEGKDSIYANLIVIRKDEINDPRIKKLVSAFQSDTVLQAAQKLFKGQAIAAW